MAVPVLTCAEFVELVTDYLEDALPPTERERFESHLSRCTGCTNYLDQIRQTIRLSGYLSEQNLAPEAKDEFLTLFRDWKLSNPTQQDQK
jgi:anti-sigma factor RsiW